MNKAAFTIFFALSLVTGAVVTLIGRANTGITVLFIIAISLITGIAAGVVHARRVRALLRRLDASARDELQIYNLPYPPAPGMDDLLSTAVLTIKKAKTSAEQAGRLTDNIKKIMDSLDIGVLVVNGRGIVVYANNYIKGFSQFGKDISGIYFMDVVRSYEVEALFNGALTASVPGRKSVTLFIPDERKFDVTVAAMEYAPCDRCYLMTLKDITGLNKIETIRQDFITNASHELKTPLTSIIGYLEALKEDYRKEFADTAYKNAKRMQRIVDDMLTLSRADRGASEFTMRQVSISETVDEVYALIRAEVEKKHQTFAVNIPEGSDVVHADRDALFHILMNLIDNAVKYSDEGKAVAVVAADTGDQVEIAVRDNGRGIPSNELDRIFERFYTVDKARSRELGGTGLGLSIVRHFVLAHGGRVWVESELNKGSAFHFTIPKTGQPRVKP